MLEMSYINILKNRFGISNRLANTIKTAIYEIYPETRSMNTVRYIDFVIGIFGEGNLLKANK